jgi:hypothetical protein
MSELFNLFIISVNLSYNLQAIHDHNNAFSKIDRTQKGISANCV